MPNLLIEYPFAEFFMLGLFVLTFYIAYRAKKGKVPYIRRLPTLDAMDRTIDMCAEMGKPIYYELSAQLTGSSDFPVQGAAALSILSYVANRCAKTGARLIIGYLYTDALPFAHGILDKAYKDASEKNRFRDDDLRYVTSDAFVAGGMAMQIAESEDCRAVIAMGSLSMDVMALIEANKGKGAISVLGTAYMTQINNIGLLSDYSLIGEELYAAGATVSGDADTSSTLRCQDLAKIFMIAAVPAVFIAIKLGVKF